MKAFRGHLRLWVTAWLLVQAASLAALVPRPCCAAHRVATAVADHACHQNAAPVHCQMQSVDEPTCPTHGSNRFAEAGAGQPADIGCAMRGACDRQVAALFALLTNYGVPADLVTMGPGPDARHVASSARHHLIARLASPDPPPPRG